MRKLKTVFSAICVRFVVFSQEKVQQQKETDEGNTDSKTCGTKEQSKKLEKLGSEAKAAQRWAMNANNSVRMCV